MSITGKKARDPFAKIVQKYYPDLFIIYILTNLPSLDTSVLFGSMMKKIAIIIQHYKTEVRKQSQIFKHFKSFT